MKRLIFTFLLVSGSLSAQAGGHHFQHGYGWGHGPSFSFFYGSYPGYAWDWPGYAYSYYPGYSYDYYPGYSSGYAYNRPNYAVSGTLLGALTGGIVGNSIHHQGWEGAGIGAAAGLLLGGLAEHNARTVEQPVFAPPAISYAPPNSTATAPTLDKPLSGSTASPSQNPPAYRLSSAMSSANALFGR